MVQVLFLVKIHIFLQDPIQILLIRFCYIRERQEIFDHILDQHDYHTNSAYLKKDQSNKAYFFLKILYIPIDGKQEPLTHFV